MRMFSIFRHILLVALVAALGFASQAAAATQTAKKPHRMAATPPNPCAVAPIDPAKWGEQPFRSAPEILPDAEGNLKATLTIRYSKPGEAMIAGCPLTLRTYDGKLMGPTFRAKPGNHLLITLKNDITPAPGEKIDPGVCNPDGTRGMNGMPGMTMAANPAVYDITNLHTHGLHVSPKDNHDNVFIELCPGQSKDYEIDIPKDHPAGTFWYHAHVHGSTALQVSSGLEGAIVIEGGADAIPAIAKAEQKIFLLQQVGYDAKGRIDDEKNFGPGGWAKSKRYITVNGQIAPKFTMRPGEVQRFRFIHGGVRETVYLSAYGPNASHVPLHEIATDGNIIGHMDDWKTVELEPGYRSDVLFKAPLTAPDQTVTYYLRSEPVLAKNSLSFLNFTNPKKLAAALTPAANEDSQIIAVIEVSGTTTDMPLPSDAELAQYVPYKPITDAELTGEPQTVSFSIETNMFCKDATTPCVLCDPKDPNKPCPPPDKNTFFMVDHFQYPKSSPRILKLGTASVFNIEVDPHSLGPEHPFHIHVNPFEMVRMGPDGKPETIWKDTLMVHQGHNVAVRSRYEDFDGAFVLHCHILDHEDGGMMQEVEIVR